MINAPAISRAAACAATVACLLGLPSSGDAKVYHGKQEALKLAFPRADSVKPRHLFIKPAQLAAINRRCDRPIKSKLLTTYVGRKGGRVLGYAFIDTHVVRTLPETFMVVLSPRGVIRAIHVLAFREPPEYKPAAGWLKQFKGKRLSPGLRIRRDIAGIAGSTLSAHAVTRATRKILVLYDVLLKQDHAPTAKAAR